MMDRTGKLQSPQGLKPQLLCGSNGAAEAAPFQSYI